VLNGILWILRTGAPWADLPNRYPSYQTCRGRFSAMGSVGVLKDILSLVAEALHHEGYLDVQEAFIDGSFSPAKKGGNCVGKTKHGKGTKIMAIADRHGLPVAVHWRAPRRMKSRWSRPPSRRRWSGREQSTSLEMPPTSLTNSMPIWQSVASS
jgi:hypothetical protein